MFSPLEVMVRVKKILEENISEFLPLQFPKPEAHWQILLSKKKKRERKMSFLEKREIT